MARFQIQRGDINGNFEDCIGGSFHLCGEAVRLAKHWARCDPNCAWGVRVVDTDWNNSVLWES